MEDCRPILLEHINPPWILLRPVDTHSIEYLQIRDTIRDGRLLNSIAVRPDPRHPGMFEVVDGMYRLTAFRELGRTHIPAIVGNETDEEVLAAQIRANAVRRETTPVEFAKQLRRIQKLRLDATGQDMPMSEMAVMLGRDVGWVAKTLALLNLTKEIQKRVERDELKLCNAYQLAKMPYRLQSQYLECAMYMPVKEFEALARTVVRGVMEAARNGKLESAFILPFEPVANLKPLKAIKEELATHKAGTEFIVSTNCQSPMLAWEAALKWAANLDGQSIEKQRKDAARRQRKQHIERTKYETLIESDPDALPE